MSAKISQNNGKYSDPNIIKIVAIKTYFWECQTDYIYIVSVFIYTKVL